MASTEVFRPYFLTMCPRCENKITREKLKLEEETRKCALCGNKIELDQEKTSIIKEEISERKRKLDEIRGRISEHEKSLKIFAENIKERKEKRIQLYRDKEKSRKRIYEEFLPEIANLNKEIGRMEAELSEIHNLKQNILENQEKISLSQFEIEVMKHFEKILKKYVLEKDTSKEQIEGYIEKYMKEFLEIAMESGFQSAELYFMEPKIDDMKFEELPAGERVRASMAIYYGLLMMGLKHDGRLPCFLIVDAPRQQEMQGDFFRIVQAYRNLDEKHGEEVQVIIASADPSVKDATNDATKIIEFEEGEMILKDKILESSESTIEDDFGKNSTIQKTLKDFQ